jgi:carbon-monoxide dehydrogenase catalytic subunit
MNKPYDTQTVTEDGRLLLTKAETDRLTTVWDRYQAQLPQCGYCEMGLSCRVCNMGPCRVDPFGDGPQTGVCGADADIIVARNLGRMIAAGAASHSDHGRDLVDVLAAVAAGEAPGYEIRNVEKLKKVAAEYGVAADGKSTEQIAGELAYAMQEDYGTRQKELTLTRRAPEKRREIWRKVARPATPLRMWKS